MEQITDCNKYALQFIGTNNFAYVYWGVRAGDITLAQTSIDKAELFKTAENAQSAIKMFKVDNLEVVPIKVSYSRVE